MPAVSENSKATVIPCLRYRNALAAIEWLCACFGFGKQAVYADSDGTVAHAQLTFGNGMIMLGSASQAGLDPDGLTGQTGKIEKAGQIGDALTQSIYVIVADADLVYDKAKSAGAEILLDIRDEDYGGRGFSCRDLEGHIWTFGTYDPWHQPGGDSVT